MIIAIEGIDGSGKSTLAKKLNDHLIEKGINAKLILSRSFHDYENEQGDEIFSHAKSLKKKSKLSALSYCLWHAADFSYRFESEVREHLCNTVFIMDRYIYTPIIRDSIRGVNLDYVKNVYSFAPAPEKIFFLDIAPNKALDRIIGRRGLPGYYESGSDFKNEGSLTSNFISYQTECNDMYKIILPSSIYSKINAEESQEKVFSTLLDTFLKDKKTNKALSSACFLATFKNKPK